MSMSTSMSNGNNNARQSRLLSLTPIDLNLTDGTDIPPPSPLKQSPITGGGPLTSHPATPLGGAVQPPSIQQQQHTMAENHRPYTNGHTPTDRPDSFRSITSPTSTTQHYDSSSPPSRRPGGVRRLFSLTNLRSSFSSSRTSLGQPRPSQDTQPQHYTNGLKRPSSPSMASSTASSQPPPPVLRSKKSTGWFKRKSGMFMLTEDLSALEEREKEPRPDTRDSKRSKRIVEPAPLLPEIGALGGGGGGLGGGVLGWDERAFEQ